MLEMTIGGNEQLNVRNDHREMNSSKLEMTIEEMNSSMLEMTIEEMNSSMLEMTIGGGEMNSSMLEMTIGKWTAQC